VWLHDNCEPKEGGDEGRGDEGGGHGVGVMWEYGVGGVEGASRGALRGRTWVNAQRDEEKAVFLWRCNL